MVTALRAIDLPVCRVADPATDLEAWHRLQEYRLPRQHTLHEPGDAHIAIPTVWPRCGCPIPASVLAWATGYATRWGRRYAVAVLMDQKYWFHAYQAHGILQERPASEQRPPRSAMTGEQLRRLCVSDEGALAAGFPKALAGSSYTWVWAHWPREIAAEFITAARDLDALARQGYGILLQGSTGTGKSCALALLAEAEIAAGGLRAWQRTQGEWRRSGSVRVKYLTLTRLELLVKNTRGEERLHLITELSAVEQLFLDEFGTQTRSEDFESTLYEILHTRWAEQRPTHVATNCDLATTLQATDRGQRLWDRWQACPRFTLAMASVRQAGAWRDTLPGMGEAPHTGGVR